MKVGKQYTHKHNKFIVTCVAISSSKELAFVEWDEGRQGCSIYKDLWKGYTEYKEPKKGKMWINIWEKSNKQIVYGTPYQGREDADCAIDTNSIKRIACVEVEWTEGQGL